jgi:hypothetical protein
MIYVIDNKIIINDNKDKYYISCSEIDHEDIDLIKNKKYLKIIDTIVIHDAPFRIYCELKLKVSEKNICINFRVISFYCTEISKSELVVLLI